MKQIEAQTILEWLEQVKDPEIPVLSLIDLGVINEVIFKDGEVTIELTPTFVGCPALEMMQQEIREVLAAKGLTRVDIQVSFKRPWNSDRISEKGKKALKAFGLAAPPSRALFTDLDILERATCPRCGSTDTDMRNPFGATLCRAIHYCHQCREAFEQFKPL